MNIGLLKDIAKRAPQGVLLAGLDVGRKTIGLALSDEARRYAMPVKTIGRVKFTQDIQALGDFIRAYEVGGLVVGLPCMVSGEEGRRAQSVRDFVAELARHPAVLGDVAWIAFWDEVLSTDAVEDIVDDLVDRRKKKVKSKDSGLIDKLAAQHILQGALDWMNRP